MAPLDLQLIFLTHLAPDERDPSFLGSCDEGGVIQVEKQLRELQDRNVADADARKDGLGTRPLHLSAAAGRVDMARLLLEFKADKEAVQHGGHRPLHRAAMGGHAHVVRLLLNSGAALKIMQALKERHVEDIDLAPDESGDPCRRREHFALAALATTD